MTPRMVLTLVLFFTLLGASFSFADGMIGDQDSIRTRGGVGNYLFYQDYRDPGKTDAILSKRQGRDDGALAADYENAGAFGAVETEIDTVDTSASSTLTVSPAETQAFGAILFPTGASAVPANEEERLDSIAGYLKADPALSAQVVGYADATGGAARNDDLSEARAQNVVRELKRRGVPENQLSWSGRGEADPVSGNDSLGGRAQNRRVEVRFE